MNSPLNTMLLPGLDGTGRLFEPLIKVLPLSLVPRIVSYPTDSVYTYQELETFVERSIPVDQPFAIVAESFSGPLALRIASRVPKGLVAVVLVASFVQSPLSILPAWVRLLIGSYLFWCLPPPWAIRRFLLRSYAPPELVSDVLAALRLVHPSVLAARVRDVLSVNSMEAFVRCPKPILYIAGTQDKLVSPGVGQQLRARRPDNDKTNPDDRDALKTSEVFGGFTYTLSYGSIGNPWSSKDIGVCDMDKLTQAYNLSTKDSATIYSIESLANYSYTDLGMSTNQGPVYGYFRIYG